MRGLSCLDLRALALWRISLGLIVLWDIALRARDLQTFYGDHGMLSRALFVQQSWEWPGFHLFLASGSTTGLVALLALWAAAAFCLTVGFHHRLAGLVAWYFVASIQLRNPMVMDGGDDLLRVLLFWTPWLPLSARWSWEARRHPEWESLPDGYQSPATFGLLLQLFVLYLFAALLKNGDDWWVTGDALYYTLSIDQFATGFGHALRALPPEVLRLLTWAALGLEYTLALLLLLRGRWGWAQKAFFLLAVTFHLGIAGMLHFGIFMYLAIGGLMFTFPSGWLDRFWPRRNPEPHQVQDSLPPAYRLGRPARLFAWFICAMIAVFNLYSLDHVQRIPSWTVPIVNLTFEQQHWHFFAPDPVKTDGWYALEVELTDGSVLDGWNPGLRSGERPTNIAATFPNQRWRRWMQNLVDINLSDTETLRVSTLEWLARQWMRSHPGVSVRGFTLLLWRELSVPPGSPTGQVERVVLARKMAPSL